MPACNQNCLIFFSPSSMQPGLITPAAGVSEALTVSLCRVALAYAWCQFDQRHVWSTGDWDAVGEDQGYKSRQKFLLLQSSRSPCLYSTSAHHFIAFSFLYFCLYPWLTLNSYYSTHGMRPYPAKTYYNRPPSSLTHLHLIFPPVLPLWPRAYGLLGQEIREMCQSAVLSKHIFHFCLSSPLF